MYRLDSADHFFSIQCDLFCHLQRKRYPPHYPCRASAQNPPFLFREKGFSRSYQHHYGRLYLPRTEFFAFYPRACGVDHFYGSDFCRSALYGLENGAGCLMGSAGCLCDCGIFRKDSGKSESESDGCEDGLRRRDTGVH